MKNGKIYTLLLAMIMLLAACSSENRSSESDTSEIEKIAPKFTLTDLNGKSHSLQDYAGQKVYVKFWASWCSICLAGLEELNTLENEEKDFVILTIVSPGYKNEKNTEAFKKWFSGVEEGANITVLLDDGGTISEHFQVRGYPTSAYISSDGILVQTLPGHVGNEQIMEKFATIK